MSLLGRRDFLLIFVAFALSSLGDYVALITLTLRVEALTGSGWAVAALLLTGLVPPVILAPVAGLLVDRLETIDGIQRGLESMNRGEGRPVEEFFEELRQKHELPD
jgi:MFS family permease